MSILPQQSVTGYLSEKAFNYLTVNEENGKITDSKTKVIAKLAGNTVANAVLVVAGLVETAIRHAIFLIAKIVQFVIPKEYSEKFDKNILMPALFNAGFTLAYTIEATTKLVTNFLSNSKQQNAYEAIFDGAEKVYTSTPMMILICLHFNGFSFGGETNQEPAKA